MSVFFRHFAFSFILFFCFVLSVMRGNAQETVLSFTGSGSYIDLGTPAALQIPSNDPFTVEGWMYLNATSIRDMLYCKNLSRGTTYTYMFGFYEGIEMAAYTGHGGSPATTWRRVAVPGGVQTERWYHLAFSFDGTNMSFYLDGDLLGEVAYSFGNYETHAIQIGGYSPASDINGMMSDVRVWDYARSATEIFTDMTCRLNGNETGLLGYWPIDEGAGGTVFDSTANSSDGTIVNASWDAVDSLEFAPAGADFRIASPFAMADKQTGDTDFTNSNEVDVVDFPVPDGYDLYQFTDGEDSSSINQSGWLSTNPAPAELSFTKPGADADIIRYAWFTNSISSVIMRRARSDIRYTTALPVPVAKVNYSRGKAPSDPVVVYPWEIDDGSTGGTTGGEEIPVHSLHLRVESGPGADATPEEPFITVSATGTYQVTLTVTNAAGNAETSTTCDLTVEEIASNTFVWEGSVDNDWFNPLNWDLMAVPFDGTEVIVNAGADIFLSAPSAELASFEMTGGALTFSNWTANLTADEITLGNAQVTCAGPFEDHAMSNRVWFVCENFTLGTNSEINVDGKGYQGGDSLPPSATAGHGPGAGGIGSGNAGGGSYGGQGGADYASSLPPYGDPSGPVYPGSGGGGSTSGGSGGHGGGAVYIECSGTARVDGVISADTDGVVGRGGTGSGGGVMISCAVFTGSGMIRAAGASGAYSAYSGGGRIAVIVSNPVAQAAMEPHRVTFSAIPGGDFVESLGSLYVSDAVILDASWMPHDGVVVVSDQAEWSSDVLNVTGWQQFKPLPGQGSFYTMNIVSNMLVSGVAARLDLHQILLQSSGSVTITDFARMFVWASNNVPENKDYGALISVEQDLVVDDNSWIYPQSEGYSGTSVLFNARNVFIAETGGIDADGRGYFGVQGEGSGVGAHWGSGAGYGGQGGDGLNGPGGLPYGSALSPLLPGSGGGRYGSSGGGLIRLELTGLCDIAGTLTVRGKNATSRQGAGSGGAILIACRDLNVYPTTLFDASGGDTNNENTGGGGGGRVAVWYGDLLTESTPPHRVLVSETIPAFFDGVVLVDGGVGGYGTGEDGTIRFIHVLYPQGSFFTSF